MPSASSHQRPPAGSAPGRVRGSFSAAVRAYDAVRHQPGTAMVSVAQPDGKLRPTLAIVKLLTGNSQADIPTALRAVLTVCSHSRVHRARRPPAQPRINLVLVGTGLSLQYRRQPSPRIARVRFTAPSLGCQPRRSNICRASVGLILQPPSRKRHNNVVGGRRLGCSSPLRESTSPATSRIYAA